MLGTEERTTRLRQGYSESFREQAAWQADGADADFVGRLCQTPDLNACESRQYTEENSGIRKPSR